MSEEFDKKEEQLDLEMDRVSEKLDADINSFSANLQSDEAVVEIKVKKSHIGRNILLVLLALIIVAYAAGCIYFKGTFLPNTTVNGVDVSNLKVAASEQLFINEVNAYELTLLERNDKTETITATDVNLQMSFGTAMQDYLDSQQFYLWPIAFFTERSVTMESMLSYDEAALASKLKTLDCMNKSKMVEAQDAYLDEYQSGVGYAFVPSVPGTVIIEKNLNEALVNAILNLQDSVDLAEENCYVAPAFTEDMPEAQGFLDKANSMVGVNISYDFGSKKEVVGADLIKDWIAIDAEALDLVLDEDAVYEYVAGLAKKYNTVGTSHSLATSYGSTITLYTGNYGWKIDKDATTEALVGYIKNGEDFSGEVEYSQRAASHDGNDYGNSYVEVNVAAQEIHFYLNGALVLVDDVTTGKPSEDSNTPCGLFGITYKQAPATLRGADYESDVHFWMPFYGDYGLHDAPWKKIYGSNYYLTIGSHGCVNLKYATAKKIYENVAAGFPVFVYYLHGTERYDTMRNLDAKILTIGTVTEQSEPVILSCRNTYNSLTEQEKGSVHNLAVLEAAEAAMAALKGEAAAE